MIRLPKYVHGFNDRHGKPRFYLRRPGRKRVALPGLPWSTEFMDLYQAALNDAAPVVVGISRSKQGSVAEAVARYLGSIVFAELAPSTQAMRRAILERFRLEHGDKRITKLEAEHVKRLLARMRPWAQRNWLKTLRGLATFCLIECLIETDPTSTVKLAKAKETGGFEPWPLPTIELYRAHHPLGTRPRLALELLYGTMAARSDMVRLGPQHVQGGIISFRRRKTTIPVDIPMLPELAAAIEAMPKAKHPGLSRYRARRAVHSGRLWQLVQRSVRRRGDH